MRESEAQCVRVGSSVCITIAKIIKIHAALHFFSVFSSHWRLWNLAIYINSMLTNDTWAKLNVQWIKKKDNYNFLAVFEPPSMLDAKLLFCQKATWRPAFINTLSKTCPGFTEGASALFRCIYFNRETPPCYFDCSVHANHISESHYSSSSSVSFIGLNCEDSDLWLGPNEDWACLLRLSEMGDVVLAAPVIQATFAGQMLYPRAGHPF